MKEQTLKAIWTGHARALFGDKAPKWDELDPEVKDAFYVKVEAERTEALSRRVNKRSTTVGSTRNGNQEAA